ncbi:MAG: LamG-like jellyroll fold domain-containing protein, partial [Ignavibacteriaceae bacterium]|nr:LamG-like jellyroll fold domain-containing protein [Ignavibacteriaceae bacterium]
MSFKKIIFIVILFMSITKLNAQTTALWTFDEQEGLYPSSVLSDISDNDYPLVIGLCGKITLGKYGNALSFGQQPDFTITPSFDPKYGLVKMKPKPGNNIEPLSWYNADFCALMTEGESHLRKEVGFKNPTQSKLNIGQFDWTIEFWYEIGENPNTEEVIFEIGSGPRGENNSITRLFLSQNENSFFLFNKPSESNLSIPTTIKKEWHHFAFVYSSSEKQLKHFVDGKIQELPMKAIIKSLPEGKEAYMSIGTTGLWKNPISGKLDELCFSEGEKYKSEFRYPDSFSPLYNNYKTANLKKGPPLLFDKEIKTPIELNDRKYLFIDDAIVKESKDIKYCVNPPRYLDRVIPNIEGSFRKHINVVEDDSGYIRLYMGIADDYLGVLVSKDGKTVKAPNLVKPYKGFINVVIAE